MRWQHWIGRNYWRKMVNVTGGFCLSSGWLFQTVCKRKCVAAVQSLSHVWLFMTPWTAARQATLSFTVSWSLLKCTWVHWVSDTIQPSHPLSSPSPLALNLSQLHSLFQWVSSSHQVAKISGASASASVLPMNIQCWFPLQLTGWISLQSKGLSRVFANTTVQKHQFFGA